jgi:hypothetical protein
MNICDFICLIMYEFKVFNNSLQFDLLFVFKIRIKINLFRLLKKLIILNYYNGKD